METCSRGQFLEKELAILFEHNDLVEGRVSKHRRSFVETFIFYQSLFDNTGDLSSILSLPYPLYKDIILAQVDEKKRETRELEKELKRKIPTAKRVGKTKKNW